jgi:WD40 repeat protein
LNASRNFASFLGSASIEIWSLADSRHPTLADRFPLPTPKLGDVSLVLSDDGKTVIAYGGESPDLLFSPQHRRGVPLRGVTSRTMLLAISRSGHRILATLGDGTAALWDANEPDRPLLVMAQFPDRLNLARFGTMEDQIVTATDSGWIRTWDVSSVGLRKALDGASPLCLTVRQRERYLQEGRTDADEGFRACEREHSRGK